MGDFRIPYGSALGKQNDLRITSAGLLVSGDTTPDVTNGTFFYTNNTSNTVITNFDLTGPALAVGDPGTYQGKYIKVLFLDDSTSLLNSSSAGGLRLTESDGTLGRLTTCDFIYFNSAWIETSRNYKDTIIRVESKNLTSVASSTGGVYVRGGVKVINCYSEAGSPLLIRKLLGGAQGQQVTLLASGPSDIRVIVNSAANDCLVSTSTSTATQFRLASSGAVTFVRLGVKWLEIAPVWANSSVTYST